MYLANAFQWPRMCLAEFRTGSLSCESQKTTAGFGNLEFGSRYAYTVSQARGICNIEAADRYMISDAPVSFGIGKANGVTN